MRAFVSLVCFVVPIGVREGCFFPGLRVPEECGTQCGASIVLVIPQGACGKAFHQARLRLGALCLLRAHVLSFTEGPCGPVALVWFQKSRITPQFGEKHVCRGPKFGGEAVFGPGVVSW